MAPSLRQIKTPPRDVTGIPPNMNFVGSDAVNICWFLEYTRFGGELRGLCRQIRESQLARLIG